MGHMRRHGAALLVVVAFATIGGVRFARAGDNAPPPPTVGLGDSSADANMLQTINGVYANNLQYLLAFTAHGVDPGTLTPAWLQGATANRPSLSSTLSAAPVVIYGHVTQTDFVPGPQDPTHFPVALAAVQIDEVVVSNTVRLHGGETIVIEQTGGPTWHDGADLSTGSGGSLAEADTDPILLPGQSIVLFLQPFPAGVTETPEPPAGAAYASAPRFIDASGALPVVSGLVAASGPSVPYACEVNGLTVNQLVALVQTAGSDPRASGGCADAEPLAAVSTPKGASPTP